MRYLILLLAMTGVLVSSAVAADESYDIVIIGGRVIDPETGLDGIRNVGVQGDRIAVVTEEAISGARTIDASGKVVSPGFIDMHAHGQSIPAGRVQALDGVTTALELEAGALPVADFYNQLAKEGRPINYGASVNWANARIATFLNKAPSYPLTWFFENFKNPVWQEKVATDEQLAKIASMVQQGLDEGGLGVGFLLGYAPGTGRKEYYEISKLAAENGQPTFTHARFLSMLEPESSFEGMEEIIAVAAATGVQAHINHMNSISLRDIDAIGELISGARSSGVRVSTEAYPYGAGSTGIGAAMFRGPEWRERTGGMTAESFDVGGKRLTEEEFETLQRDHPETQTIAHFLDTKNPEDRAFLDKSVLFPGGTIASDGVWWTIEGESIPAEAWPLPKNAKSHPRSAGTYSRFLRHYVRETKAVSLMEAIERMSFRPAEILQDSVPQMKKKGRIQPGADADIVIFDLATVTDNATYATPAQVSSGFSHVLVNGVPLVEDGKLNTDVLPGRAIRNNQK